MAVVTVEKVFEHDAYAGQCDAVVVSVGARGIRLNRTVFYAVFYAMGG